MDLETLTLPKSVIESADFVMTHASHVTIHDEQLQVVAKKVTERLARGIDTVEDAFGSTGILEHDVNVISFETACNFYFWGEKNATTWKSNANGQNVGGWYGLAACFANAIARGIPVHDANWMATLTVEKARDIFTGSGSQIPLLEQRVNNIVEMATSLLRHYDGQALNLVIANDYSAPRIAEEVVRMLPSFRDGAMYHGKWSWILKRAQILPSDLSQLSAAYPDFVITDCDQLTAFADYRLPQILRYYKAISYSAQLAHTVDSGRILPSGSDEEIEIRAATITACERLKRYLPTVSSASIDLGLWLLSQDLRHNPDLQPHHRTPGYFY